MTRCPRCQRRLPPTGECEVHGRPSTFVTAAEEPLPVVAPPGYKLGPLIAMGGSAAVYAVRGRAPAILKWGRWRDRDIHDRFSREADILRSLGAPITPNHLDHGAIDGWPYLLMEDVPGETLATWMSRSGNRGTFDEIVEILKRLARSLHFLHVQGYVHRDLKPENIILGDDTVRVLDFGLATRENDATAPGAFAGTVHYIAPEQLKTGGAIDRRTDVYALGVIAYEMITALPPFIGERRALEYQHRVVRPPPMRELRDVPEELERLVLACLAKEPQARPSSAEAFATALATVNTEPVTQRRKGDADRGAALDARDPVVLAWIDGAEPLAVSRAIEDVHGVIVRSRRNAVLAAFAAQFHEAPITGALGACRSLAGDRCQITVHATTALVRRSPTGKPTFYGPDLENPATWVPSKVFTGVVLTASAAQLVGGATPALDVPGFFREPKQRSRTDITDIESGVRLVGRDRVLAEIAAIANAGGVLVGLFGEEGTGKTRLFDAVIERLAAQRREVIAIRGRRRLLGDRPDDERLLDALGGSSELGQALAEVAARRAIVMIDDLHWFSVSARTQLLRPDLPTTRVITSRAPLFEVAPGQGKRLAIELRPLAYADAERLLRDLLVPARLIPDVLIERLSIRAGCNPGLLVALARDIKSRGGIRRQEGGDEWYVAADEIDTLLAAPSAAWSAHRGVDGLTSNAAAVARITSALGPKFSLDEITTVTDMSEAHASVAELVAHGVLAERNGWYEFVDANLQDAIYLHVLEDRSRVHAAAMRYWLGHRIPNLVGWLARVAHHATGCNDAATIIACSPVLAREARRRGEDDVAAELEHRVHLVRQGPPTTLTGELLRAAKERRAIIADVVSALDEQAE